MSTSLVTVAVDAMGGDHGPSVTLHGVSLALATNKSLRVLLVGQKAKMEPFLKEFSLENHPRVELLEASEVVEMDESPALALRNKKDSSMRVAINAVKEQRASACVSAGNTGALMATSRFVLKMIPGVDRPAIMYSLPTFDPKTKKLGQVDMLDLGANVGCTEEHLFQFAVMGSVFAQQVKGKKSPKVALLNIGEEDTKGLDVIKLAAQKISQCPSIHYSGYVEGTDIFEGKADVIVCDGFIGNVALKTIEGTVRYMASHIKAAVYQNWFTRLCGFLALPIFRRIKRYLDLRQYNGASLLGLRGVVIKSHGSATGESFATAIGVAFEQAKRDIPNQIHAQIETIFEAVTNAR